MRAKYSTPQNTDLGESKHTSLSAMRSRLSRLSDISSLGPAAHLRKNGSDGYVSVDVLPRNRLRKYA
jgi:hypothetical protein